MKTPLRKVLFSMSKRTLMRGLVATAALAAAGSAFANTTYNNFAGYNDAVHPLGNPNTATYGETFSAPTNGDVNLQDFGFYMGNPFVAGDILLRAYIATWTGTQAGTLLYTSPNFDFANTGNAHLTFSTSGLTLTPGASYVAFLSVSELYGQSSGETYISLGDPTIPGGNFVFYNNSGDFGALFNSTWDFTGIGPQWAFNATFTPGVPDGGSTLALLSGAFALVGAFNRKLRKK
jgi:VPDSG-CTERM motif